jgi:ketosteroid isomerase-like protein
MQNSVREGTATQATLDAVDRFNEAFNRHDVDAVMALMTDDVVFESTSPAPDGQRYEGQGAVRAAWEGLFSSSPGATFKAEEIVAASDRCTVRWQYSFDGGHIRGVDVLRVRDGKVAEKLSYVKG